MLKIFGDFSTIERRKVRHCAFVIVTNRAGLLAIDENHQNTRVLWDLPGGGLEYLKTSNGRRRRFEIEEETIQREAKEEVGVLLKPGARLREAIECYASSDGVSQILTYSAFWTAEYLGERQPTETGHTRRWMDPLIAMSKLRHESHRWAIAEWLRWDQRDQGLFSQNELPRLAKGARVGTRAAGAVALA
jgi:8-oxo-dGTP diphosphatase